MPNFIVVFDEVMQKQFQQALKEGVVREILKKWFDKLEEKGPLVGKLLDSRIWLYELKNKKPPLRLYYQYQKTTNKIIIFECEMKTSEKKQKQSIERLRYKFARFLNLFVYIPSFLDFRCIQAGVDRASFSEAF